MKQPLQVSLGKPSRSEGVLYHRNTFSATVEATVSDKWPPVESTQMTSTSNQWVLEAGTPRENSIFKKKNGKERKSENFHSDHFQSRSSEDYYNLCSISRNLLQLLYFLSWHTGTVSHSTLCPDHILRFTTITILAPEKLSCVDLVQLSPASQDLGFQRLSTCVPALPLLNSGIPLPAMPFLETLLYGIFRDVCT